MRHIWAMIMFCFPLLLWSAGEKKVVLKEAVLVEADTVRIKLTGMTSEFVDALKVKIEPQIAVKKVERKGPFLFVTTSTDYKEDIAYTISLKSGKTVLDCNIDTTLLYEIAFDQMYTDKKLGYSFESGYSVFRLFVPRGKKVELHLFKKYDETEGTVYQMRNDGNQVFEYKIAGALWGMYYGYRITERAGTYGNFLPELPPDTIFADPYSYALATSNIFPQQGRTLIYDISSYNWEDDQYMKTTMADAVISEAHVKDLTAHMSSETRYPGTYKGVIDAKVGGLTYLKQLGINVVEFQPLQDFANREPPYKVKSHGFFGNWNVYEQNYWGYMTTNFFAPESYYATDGTLDPAKWNGTDGRAVEEMRDMVKAFHKNRIAVVMDVVYNHVSQYDVNPLKIIDYDFYFKKTDTTGCGNELNSNRKMTRKLIVDSVSYWVKEYHVDGFRFDLALCLDPLTVKEMITAVKTNNPNALMIAEPWVASGTPSSTKQDYINAGYAIWNEGSRSAIRGGANRPLQKGSAFMLGNASNAKALARYWKGDSLGASWQEISYICSHDDTTIGDMIRILTGTYSFKTASGAINRITDRDAYVRFTPAELQMAKNAATALFLCQGPVMLHLGEEFGRAKITPNLAGKYPELTDSGPIGSGSDNLVYNTPSPNSYQADNETNYINYGDVKLNNNLYQYYKGLIKLKEQEPLLKKATPADITILEAANKNSLGVMIKGELFGFVNTDPAQNATYTIPAGKYSVLVNGETAGITELSEINGGSVTVPAATSLIIRKK